MRQARGTRPGFGPSSSGDLRDGRESAVQGSLWDAIARPTTKRQASPASAAAAATTERTSASRARAALREYARGDELTADECAARLGLQPLQLRPRVSNLLQAGLLELADGKQRPTALGAPQDVLRISANGRRMLAGNTGWPR